MCGQPAAFIKKGGIMSLTSQHTHLYYSQKNIYSLHFDFFLQKLTKSGIIPFALAVFISIKSDADKKNNRRMCGQPAEF